MARHRDGKLRRKTEGNKPRPQWLCVVEVNDRAGPRRSPLYPQLKVFKTSTLPGPELEQRLARKGVYMQGDYVAVRSDLMPPADAFGGRDNPAVFPAGKKALEETYITLRSDLEAAGCTVNRRESAVYRLYVCGLEKGCIARRKGASCGDLYVGQTSKTIEARLQEHRTGHDGSGRERFRSNKYVRKHFEELRQSLIPGEFPEVLFCLEHALRAESLLRLWLERDGYTVEGAQERYGDMKRAAAGSSLGTVLENRLMWPNRSHTVAHQGNHKH
jgi:hypothetical protein